MPSIWVYENMGYPVYKCNKPAGYMNMQNICVWVLYAEK